MEERTDSGEKQGGGKQPCLRCIRKGEREKGRGRGGPRTKGVKGGGEGTKFGCLFILSVGVFAYGDGNLGVGGSDSGEQ